MQYLLRKYRIFKGKLLKKFSALSIPDYSIFSIFSVIIGIAAGLAAVLFHNAIEFFNYIFFGNTANELLLVGALAVIIIPAIGMLIQSLMIRFAPVIAKKKGVSEIIKNVALKEGFIPLKVTIFHFLAPVICIGSGGTVGPEGPAAQLGGGVASRIGRYFNLSDERIRIYTAAGAGAAIAAIFNTPLGGVFFALEIVLLNDLHTPTFSALILASVSASAVSRVLLGNDSVFIFHVSSIENYSNLYLFALLGLLSGIVAVLFIKYSGLIQKFFRKQYIEKQFPQWAAMVVVGLLVGVSGFYYKEIFGIGYTAINEILAGSLTWKAVAIIFLLKFLLVPLVLYSGGFGGVFAPSLFIGACFGFLFAFFINHFWNFNIDPVVMVLVGMGAMLGGINTIPISAIMIIFEMTQDYSYILPLMLAVIISNMFVQISLRGAVHVKFLEAEGFRVTENKEKNILRNITIGEIDLDPIDLIKEETRLPQLISKFIESPANSFYLVDNGGNLSGIITESEIKPIITEYELVKDVLIARDIANQKITVLSTNDDLDYVLNLFGKSNMDRFPVINSNNPKEILGSVTRSRVIEIYNHESLKLNLASGLARELKTIDRTTPVKVSVGYSITEEVVPSEFVGKSLIDLKLRNQFGIEVLMIKQYDDVYGERNEPKVVTPDPDYKFRASDSLVIFGDEAGFIKFRKKYY